MIYNAKWLDNGEVAALRERQFALATSVVRDTYWPELPLHVADSLVSSAIEYWAVGPAIAAGRLTDPKLRNAIIAAYHTRGNAQGVLLVPSEDEGGYRTANTVTERNWSKLQIAGGLWIGWPEEETVQ
jgi:hypothetical protein